jgi:hypothetical protein
VERVEFLDDHGGHAGAGLGVEIDRNIEIGPQTFAQGLDVAYRLGDLLVGLDPFVVVRQAAFERGDPLRRGTLAKPLQLLQGSRVGDVVAAHALGILRTAEKLVYRDPQDFAAHVP